jgi:dienelactone hydrolase
MMGQEFVEATMRRWLAVRIAVVVVLAAAVLPGWAAETGRAKDAPLKMKQTAGETVDWLEAFAAPKPGEFEYTVEAAAEPEQIGGVVMERVTFPSAMTTPWAENNLVPGELYLPAGAKADGKLPAAVVLDILDGRAILPRMMARALAQRGVAAFYFPMPYYNVRRPKDDAHKKLAEQDPKNVLYPIRQTVMDVRRGKAVLMTRPEIDPTRIGITGISLGGIMTSLAAGVDGEFYRVAPIMAGGDLATIIFHTRETRKVREMLLARGIDRDALAKLLEPVEPLNFASRIEPATCLMINASYDEVIPNATTLALRKMIGDPTILWMPTGHYSCALFLPNAEQKVADFMLGAMVTSLDFAGAAGARETK